MRILVDTNVFLDVLMVRQPWLPQSRAVLNWCDAHPGQAWIAWHTLSNLYYIGAKTAGTEAAREQIDAILDVFDVAAGDTTSARKARRLAMPDFEDALQAIAALNCGADAIVTRNLKDYQNSPVKPLSPEEFAQL